MDLAVVLEFRFDVSCSCEVKSSFARLDLVRCRFYHLTILICML